MSRLIFKSGTQASNDVRDILQGMFTMVIARPGQVVWLNSPWLSDIPIIDNRADEFSRLVPEWPASEIPLTTVLATLARRDSDIRITVRPDDHGVRFVRHLAATAERFDCQDHVHVRYLDTKHGKGFLIDQAYLSGSMNITFNGIFVNEEDLRFDTDAATIAHASLEFAKRWDALPEQGPLP